jgi:hypothetical protein
MFRVSGRSPQIWQRRFLQFSLGLIFVITYVVLGLNPPSVAQSSITQATIADILDGTQVYIQDSQASVNDVATRGERVRTGSARAQLNYNNGAVGRLSQNSAVTIGNECTQLQSGGLIINGAVNGCTNSVVAGVHGTTYLLEVDEDGNETVKVLEGEVQITRKAVDTSDSMMPSEPETTPETMTEPDSVVLNAGDKVSTRPGDRLNQVERMGADEFIEIILGELIQGFTEELPGMSRIRESFSQLFPGTPFPTPSIDLPDGPPTPRLPF